MWHDLAGDQQTLSVPETDEDLGVLGAVRPGEQGEPAGHTEHHQTCEP
jgi:hypothetical protein